VRRGFTLIELLIVVVIIGLLVSIALPRFAAVRDKAHRTQMISDLRTLVSAQESYYDGHLYYANNVTLLDFNRTPAVTIEITDAAMTGWAAKATHGSTAITCGIFVGSSSPPTGIPATSDGVPACDG
jgi:prepilin-type N-terminal cleavage/methylation domain-containing protein